MLAVAASCESGYHCSPRWTDLVLIGRPRYSDHIGIISGIQQMRIMTSGTLIMLGYHSWLVCSTTPITLASYQWFYKWRHILVKRCSWRQWACWKIISPRTSLNVEICWHCCNIKLFCSHFKNVAELCSCFVLFHRIAQRAGEGVSVVR